MSEYELLKLELENEKETNRTWQKNHDIQAFEFRTFVKESIKEIKEGQKEHNDKCEKRFIFVSEKYDKTLQDYTKITGIACGAGIVITFFAPFVSKLFFR